MLIHLSEDNNNPDIALKTLKSTFNEKNIEFDDIIISSQKERTELVNV